MSSNQNAPSMSFRWLSNDDGRTWTPFANDATPPTSFRWLSNDDGRSPSSTSPAPRATLPLPPQQAQQPAESATSYFPEGRATRRSSSAGSVDSSSDSDSDRSPGDTESRTSASSWKPPLKTSPTGDYPLPAIDTPFPKPAVELDVAAQLAKEPLPWSLHSSLRRAAAHERRAKVEDAGARARALEEAKREWMSWRL
ncbi:hypothetical protein SLS62_010588 [Diatrype stigma]|uniref:Uncharacterized protein n=1 Tax=Diatrype stigma TaxID=117547 RepID=A0AAN9UBN6_9PEZI